MYLFNILDNTKYSLMKYIHFIYRISKIEHIKLKISIENIQNDIFIF